MVLYFIVSLILISVLTVLITLGVYSWFNKEDEKIKEMTKLLGAIGNDTSQLIKDIKLLASVASDVAKPLINPSVVDIASEEVVEDKNNDDVQENIEVLITDEINALETNADKKPQLEVIDAFKKDDSVENSKEDDIAS